LEFREEIRATGWEWGIRKDECDTTVACVGGSVDLERCSDGTEKVKMKKKNNIAFFLSFFFENTTLFRRSFYFYYSKCKILFSFLLVPRSGSFQYAVFKKAI
jgi:hypothetical protein